MSILDIANKVADEKGSSQRTKIEPPREGIALFRMCSVLEMGVVESEWAGKKKQNRRVIVEFELVHPDHMVKDDEGKFKYYPKCRLYLNKSGFDKSKYMKLFNKLNYDGSVHVEPNGIPPMSRFLGKGFLGYVHHKQSGERTFVNMEKDGEYTIGAPRTSETDDMGMPTGRYRNVSVPAMEAPMKLFLWEPEGITDAEYREMWDSIYIEGEYDGKSKNWIQDAIMSEDNIAFPGSRAEALFVNGAAHEELDEDIDEVPWSNPKPAPEAPVRPSETILEPTPTPATAEAPKKRRKRRTKAEMEAARDAEAEQPKVRRKRRTKAEIEAAKQREAATEQVEDDPLAALGI